MTLTSTFVALPRIDHASACGDSAGPPLDSTIPEQQRPDGRQMFAHRSFGALGVALFDGRDDRRVFVVRILDRSGTLANGLLHTLGDQLPYIAVHDIVEREQQRILRRLRDGPVQTVI